MNEIERLIIQAQQKEARMRAIIEGALNILISGWSEIVVINW